MTKARLTTTLASTLRTLGAAGTLAAMASAPAAAQDILTVGTASGAPGTSVNVPIYVRDASGTPLGTDVAGALKRIQGLGLRISFPPALGTATGIAKAGICAALTPIQQSVTTVSGSIGYVASYAQATNPIPLTLNAAAPGQQIATLTIAIGAAAPVGPYTLTVDTAVAKTGLANENGTLVEDTGTPASFTTVNGSVTVTSCPTITVSPTTLPGGQVGQAYSQNVTASGGTGPYAYSATGSLPPGVTLSAAGLLSGTPTAGGPYNFTVNVTDANLCPGSRAYTLTIGACPTITVGPATSPDATLGKAYSLQLTASGGTGPYTYSTADPLPAGLTLSAAGLLSGTPTAVGATTFSVAAKDANNCTGSKSVTVTVYALRFYTVTPCRVLDTRGADGPALVAGGERAFTVTGSCGIGAGVRVISTNVTVTQPTAGGNLRIYPADVPIPGTSVINFGTGQTRANNLILRLDADGKFKVSNDSTGTVHMILDVNGYLD